MTRAEAWDIVEQFEKCCYSINKVFPEDFWKNITKFPCCKDIGTKVKQLNDYIKNEEDVDIAKTFVEFVNDDAFEYCVCDIFINIAFFADNPKKDLIAKEMINCVEYIQSIQQWLVLKMSDFKISPQQTAGYIYKNGNIAEHKPVVTTIKWPQEFKSIKAKRALFLAVKKRLMTMTPTACEWLSSLKALAYFAEQLSKELHWSTVECYSERRDENFEYVNYKPILAIFPNYTGKQLADARISLKKSKPVEIKEINWIIKEIHKIKTK